MQGAGFQRKESAKAKGETFQGCPSKFEGRRICDSFEQIQHETGSFSCRYPGLILQKVTVDELRSSTAIVKKVVVLFGALRMIV